MPLGEGWWLNISTGKSFYVDEHASAVAANPKQYGIQPSEVEGLNPMVAQDRDKIRDLAVKKGWARIRAHGNRVVVEFYYDNLTDAVFAAMHFLGEQAFGELTVVEIHDLKRRGRHTETLGALMKPGGLEKALDKMGVVFTETEATRLNRLLKALENHL